MLHCPHPNIQNCYRLGLHTPYLGQTLPTLPRDMQRCSPSFFGVMMGAAPVLGLTRLFSHSPRGPWGNHQVFHWEISSKTPPAKLVIFHIFHFWLAASLANSQPSSKIQVSFERCPGCFVLQYQIVLQSYKKSDTWLPRNWSFLRPICHFSSNLEHFRAPFQH